MPPQRTQQIRQQLDYVYYMPRYDIEIWIKIIITQQQESSSSLHLLQCYMVAAKETNSRQTEN